MTSDHTTTVRKMGTPRNPCYMAQCSCGWESSNLCSHREQAQRDSQTHRREEALSGERGDLVITAGYPHDQASRYRKER